MRQHGFIALQGLFLFSTNYLIFYWATGLLTSGIVALMFSTVILMNIVNGALFMTVFALASGVPFNYDSSFSYSLSLIYLAVFGSILAFSAYQKPLTL